MMDRTKLTQARIFMGKECTGKNKCASCGLERADTLSRKAIKSSFVDFDSLLIAGGAHLCQSCIDMLNDKDMRFKPLLFTEQGVKTDMEREKVLNLLKAPPEKFVMTLPYSFKKHHWLYAGLSDNRTAYIGTDTRTVIIDYTQYDVKTIIETVVKMIGYGIPRKEITIGKYSLFTESKFPGLRQLEEIIAPLRASGAIELFVKYTPAVKSKINYEWEEKAVLNDSEKKAIELLKEVAQKSLYRQEDGMRFWDGYFKRRVNRFRDLELNEFFSRLSGSVNADVSIKLDSIKELTEDESEKVMEEIRNKTDLLLALTFSEMKEARQTYKKKQKEETAEYEEHEQLGLFLGDLEEVLEEELK